MKYCGKRTFEESIATNQKANIIVPFGGVKSFSCRKTIEEPLMAIDALIYTNKETMNSHYQL